MPYSDSPDIKITQASKPGKVAKSPKYRPVLCSNDIVNLPTLPLLKLIIVLM
jgi:hypothetical protein